MMIDFHTHIFPEKIAGKTLAHLGALCGLTPAIDGTYTGLLQSMKEAGIFHSVVLPVVTKPSQFDSILAFATQINSMEHLTSFGGIHPQCQQIEEKLDAIVAAGLPGIKLHPDYQQTDANDPRYVHIVDQAIQRNLIVVFHAGVDIGLPEIPYSTPAHFASLLDQLSIDQRPQAKVVLAHTGGYRYWDDVAQMLAGRNVYFDLSFTHPFATDAQVLSIIEKHGYSRILFATDCPWRQQASYVDWFRSLPLSARAQQAILWDNGASLLGLSPTSTR